MSGTGEVLEGCLSSGVLRWRSGTCTVWFLSRWTVPFFRSGRDVWGVVGSVFSSCALWSYRCSIVERPEFDSRIVCEGGERLMSWRCQGVDMCVGMACGSICWHICRKLLWWQNRRSHSVMYSLVNTEMKNKWSDEPLTNYGNWRAGIHNFKTRVNNPVHYSTSYLSISFMYYCTFHQPAKNYNVFLHYL